MSDHVRDETPALDNEQQARIAAEMSQQLELKIWQALDQVTVTYEGVAIPWTSAPHITVVALTSIVFTIMTTLITRDAPNEVPRAVAHCDELRRRVLTLAGLTAASSTGRPS